MDYISDSTYPAPRTPYMLSYTLFLVGALLFVGAPVNYMLIGNAEDAMILVAYSFFFFAGSAIMKLCSSYDN